MLDDYLPHFNGLQQQMTWRLSTLVEDETPTSEKTLVDKVMTDLQGWGADYGAEVSVHQQSMVAGTRHNVIPGDGQCARRGQ